MVERPVAWLGRCRRPSRDDARHDLFPAEPHIEGFLTDLAVHGHMPPTTRHQAMPTLVRLDTRVPNHTMKDGLDTLCADQKRTVPMVMTRETAAELSGIHDTAH